MVNLLNYLYLKSNYQKFTMLLIMENYLFMELFLFYCSITIDILILVEMSLKLIQKYLKFSYRKAKDVLKKETLLFLEF